MRLRYYLLGTSIILLLAGIYYWRNSAASEAIGAKIDGNNSTLASGSAIPITAESAEKPATTSGGADGGEKKHFSSLEEFHSFTDATMQKLPRLADFKKLKVEEVHEAPLLLRQAGATLGDIAQAVKDDPYLAPEAFHFYEKCAAQNDLPSSIRALCYSHYLAWGAELNETLNTSIVPDDVKALAKKL